MTPEDFTLDVAGLCQTCALFGQRGWCRATSGNFSVRVASEHCLITQSGREKSTLSVEDLMLCDLNGEAVDPNCRPSAETPLHTLLYRLDAAIGSVLHTHSVTATVLSRSVKDCVELTGFEMQKAISGIETHEETVRIPVFENSQDMHALADTVQRAWEDSQLKNSGFLIRGHGLYAWGNDLQTAKRHVEGLEFLFDCTWQEFIKD